MDYLGSPFNRPYPGLTNQVQGSTGGARQPVPVNEETVAMFQQLYMLPPLQVTNAPSQANPGRMRNHVEQSYAPKPFDGISKPEDAESQNVQKSLYAISESIKDKAKKNELPTSISSQLLNTVASITASLVQNGARAVQSALSTNPDKALKTSAARGGFSSTLDEDCVIYEPSSGPTASKKRTVFKMETTPEPEAPAKKARKMIEPTMEKEHWEKAIKYAKDIDTRDMKEITRIITASRQDLARQYLTPSTKVLAKTHAKNIKDAHKENWGFPVFILKFTPADANFNPVMKTSDMPRDLKDLYDQFIESMGFPKGFDGNQATIDAVQAFYDKQS